jgi:hypothetical protein
LAAARLEILLAVAVKVVEVIVVHEEFPRAIGILDLTEKNAGPSVFAHPRA